METPVCKKCGTQIENFSANKRGQLVGKCPNCGKWGNLGTANNGEEKPKEGDGKEGGKAAAKPAGKTARATGRATGKRRPVGGPGEPVGDGGGKAGTGDFAATAKRAIRWLLS